MTDFKVFISDEDMPVLQYILAAQQKAEADTEVEIATVQAETSIDKETEAKTEARIMPVEPEPKEKLAPKDEADLVQAAFDGIVLAMWRTDYERQKIVNIQATLDNSSPEVKEAAVSALAALQAATPEQQKAALEQVTATLIKQGVK